MMFSLGSTLTCDPATKLPRKKNHPPDATTEEAGFFKGARSWQGTASKYSLFSLGSSVLNFEDAKMLFKTSSPRHIRKGTLVGAFDLEMPSGLKILGAMLFEKDGKRWVNFPSKEWIDKDGNKKYLPLLEFTSSEVRDRFQAEVLPLAEAALGVGTEASKPAEQRPANWREAGIYGEKRAPAGGARPSLGGGPLDDTDIPFMGEQ
jgi:hypothetical protein